MDALPWFAIGGGALIGLSATLLMLANGRIAGISGIFFNSLGGPVNERLWRLLFLAGLIIGAAVTLAWLPDYPPAREGFPLALVIIAGLVTGMGTRLGSGCTSGHGICGISRLSGRSVAATLVFMASAMVTVFVARHLLGAG